MHDRSRNLLDLMRVRNGVSVDEVARELGLTRTTVINHLRSLMVEGLVQRSGLRPGVRRPSVVYKLTNKADRIFPESYEEFLTDVLGELSSQRRNSFKQVVSGVCKRWVMRDLPAVKHLSGAKRLRSGLEVLSKRGFMPTLEGSAGRRILLQHNCPLKHVCEAHAEVPDAIRRWMQAMIGISLTRSKCVAKGDDLCSYVIARPS